MVSHSSHMSSWEGGGATQVTELPFQSLSQDYPSLTVVIQVREVVIKWLLNEGPARNSSGIRGLVIYLLCNVFQRCLRLEIGFAGGTCHKARQQETVLGFH